MSLNLNWGIRVAIKCMINNKVQALVSKNLRRIDVNAESGIDLAGHWRGMISYMSQHNEGALISIRGLGLAIICMIYKPTINNLSTPKARDM